jgi:phosphatidylinositol-3-phosphatase
MRRMLAGVVLLALSAGCSAQAGHLSAAPPLTGTAEAVQGGSGAHVVMTSHRKTKTTSTTTTPAPTTTTPAPTTTTPAPTTTTAVPSSTVTKTLVVFVENHTLAQMQAGMPYLNSLAHTYAYATGYTAATHPSLPNYLAVAGGSTFGITDDNDPSAHPLNGASVFGQALTKGGTAAVYAESEPSNCYPTGAGGLYAVRHTAWPYFVDEVSACKAGQVPSGDATSGAFAADAAAGRLPNVGWLIPNLCNDAHDCALSVADNWLKTMLPDVFNGPDWKSGHLAVVVTADEDDRSGGNTVLTVVAQPSLAGKVVTSPLTHYSLSAFLSAMSGSTPLRSAANAPSFAAAFGLTTP